MTESLLLIQTLQFILSSLVVFVSTALLVEISIFLFKIKNNRIRTLFRYVPIVKLPFDLILYILSACAHFTNFNPLSCQSYVENMIVRIFHLDVQVTGSIYTTHPFAEYLSKHLPMLGLQITAVAIGSVLLGMIIHKFIVVIKSFTKLQSICVASIPSIRRVTNERLKDRLFKKKVTVCISNEVVVPTAALKNYILFPQEQYDTLSQKEFEAIIAHELEHLCWHDPILKFTSSLIGSFFWWLPTKRWINKIEEEQEYSSDASISQYGLENHDLASAVLKISQTIHNKKQMSGPLCYLTHSKPFTVRRLEELLNIKPAPPLKFYVKRSIIAATLSIILLIIFRIC
ncbi:MAG: hypothetical protein NTX49_06815 [Chlamydiae bacterium]|nr:hypothetical protein [Chlamydiota bacterium]